MTAGEEMPPDPMIGSAADAMGAPARLLAGSILSFRAELKAAGVTGPALDEMCADYGRAVALMVNLRTVQSIAQSVGNASLIAMAAAMVERHQRGGS